MKYIIISIVLVLMVSCSLPRAIFAPVGDPNGRVYIVKDSTIESMPEKNYYQINIKDNIATLDFISQRTLVSMKCQIKDREITWETLQGDKIFGLICKDHIKAIVLPGNFALILSEILSELKWNMKLMDLINLGLKFNVKIIWLSRVDLEGLPGNRLLTTKERATILRGEIK